MQRPLTVGGLIGAAAGLPAISQASDGPFPVFGFLHSELARARDAELIFRISRNLGCRGLIEGDSFRIEYRWANGQFSRLPEFAADLVQRKVSVITTLADTSAALAAKSATSTIPIVFATGGDPVKMGIDAGSLQPAGRHTS